MSKTNRISGILAAVLAAAMMLLAAVCALPAEVHAEDLVSVTIGEGTDTTTDLPYRNDWNYSRTQMIYKADEIGTDGLILSLAFNVAEPSEYKTRSLRIWMGYTNLDRYDYDKSGTIAGSEYTLRDDDLELVYNGAPTLGTASGWETIELDSPFNYKRKNGNLVIVTSVKTNNGGNNDLKYYWTLENGSYTDRNNLMALIAGDQSDGTIADFSYSGSRYWVIRSARPNIMLDMDTSEQPVELHRVTFDADGGTPVPESQRVAEGDKVVRPSEDPVKEGCTFAGWYDGDTEYDFETPVTAPVRLKAKWDKNVYEIKFVDEDGETLLQTLEVTHGDMPEYTGDTPVKSGEGGTEYVFAGWEPAVKEADGPQTYKAVYMDKSLIADKTELNKVLKAAQDAKTGVRTSDNGKDVGPKFTYVTPAERQKFDDATTAGQVIADDPRATQEAVEQAISDIKSAQEAFLAARKPGTKTLPAIEKIIISKESGRQQPAVGGIYIWQVTFSEGADLSKISSDDFQIQRKPSGSDWKNSKCPVAMFDPETGTVEGQAIPDNNKEGDNTNLWRFAYAGESNVSEESFPVITQDGYVFIDKEALNNAIKAATDAQEGIMISPDGMDIDPENKFVTAEDANALDKAIKAAQKVSSDGRASQKHVDDAAQALNDALDKYIKAIRDGRKGTAGDGTADEVSHGDYHLIQETETLALPDIPVREFKQELNNQEGYTGDWFNDRPIEFEFYNSTTQQSEGVYTTHEGTYTDENGVEHKVQLLSGVKLIKGHYYLVSVHDKDYIGRNYYEARIADDGYGESYTYTANMANHYITINDEKTGPVDIKRREEFKSFGILKRTKPLSDITDSRRVTLSIPVYYTQDGTAATIITRVLDATVKLSSPEETLYVKSDEYGLVNVSLIEDIDYVVQLVEDKNALAIQPFPLTVKDHAENGWPKSIYNHFSCTSVQGLYMVDKKYEHANDTTLVSPSGRTTVTGMNFRNERPTATDLYFINDRDLGSIDSLKGKDHEVFIIEAINMYRTELSKLAAGDFICTHEIPKGKTVDKVYFISKSGKLKSLDFKVKSGKVEYEMNTLSMYPNVIVYKDKLGEGGTALGKGASLAAAEKAIAKIGISSDKDPAGTVFNKLRLQSAKQTRNSVTVKWAKASGAKKYILYGNLSGKKHGMKKITSTSKTSFKVTKVAGAKLKAGKYYKFIVVAVDADDSVVSASKVIHVATKGGKAGNYKSVSTKAKKNKVTIKKGKTFKLKAKQIKANKKLKVSKHASLRYETTNKGIATVSSKGVIKGKKKGTCYVYAYTQSGTHKKIKVTVK